MAKIEIEVIHFNKSTCWKKYRLLHSSNCSAVVMKGCVSGVLQDCVYHNITLHYMVKLRQLQSR